MTVRELLERMSSRELTEWMAYAQIEPFGEERGDIRQAITSSLIANANRDPKKQSKAYEPEDFMPFSEKPDPAETQAQALRDKLMGLNRHTGAQ